MNTVRIVIADDHVVLRQGLRVLIESEPGLQVVGEADNGLTAFDLIESLRPDLLILDIAMPKMNGIQLLARLRARGNGGGGAVGVGGSGAGGAAAAVSGGGGVGGAGNGGRVESPRVLVLTAHAEIAYLRQMLAAGASGFVVKRSAANDLMHAIRIVMAGGTYLDPDLAGKVASGFSEPRKSRATKEGDQLSERELEVLREVARGYSNKEIAQRLEISVKTVETHKANLMEKLNLHGRADLVRYALMQGWLGEA